MPAAPTKNPANEVKGLPKNFKPMTTAVLRLQVPEISGYHLHWFRGTAERIARAQQAGYTFVDEHEIDDDVNNFDLAGDSAKSGSTDLGSRVSVISGDNIANDGQPGRLFLMKCPEEFFEVGQKVVEERNDSVATTLKAGLLGSGNDETQSDRKSRYLKSKVPDLFNPNKRRP